jgi:hypothetical protein
MESGGHVRGIPNDSSPADRPALPQEETKDWTVGSVLFCLVADLQSGAEKVGVCGQSGRRQSHQHWLSIQVLVREIRAFIKAKLTCRYPHNDCGLNGDSCRPFNNSTFTFRCPASCLKAEVLEPYAVGGQMINYRPLVIGGARDSEAKGYSGAVYRADSYICSAAIHAGYISDDKGGCGVMRLIGDQEEYTSEKRNGIQSIAFDSWFPKSFEFVKDAENTCRDLRWPLLAVSVIFSTILSLCTESPIVFFWSIFPALFAHVALVSDPPGYADYRALISIMIGRFLPAAFCAAVMYLSAVRYTLGGLNAHVEKTILWLGACWVGALNNYTFDKIPISRLTPHDLAQQPGAVPALIIIICVLLSIALSQAWFIRIEGIMPKYLLIYGLLVGGVLLMVAIPGLKVRIHHYILALIFIPGTRLQMRASLVYQGLLVGLFINGVARWGFDSLLQTPSELRGDAPMDTRLPTILPPIVHYREQTPANITFEWTFPPDDERFEGERYDGISILVNDVERFRGYKDQEFERWTWERLHGNVPEYFRFAYMIGGESGDYTRAGTWNSDGSWIDMEPGPS